MTDEIRYRLLKCLAERPGISQRELARELGISIGKTNYCLRALIDKGWLKVRNFRRSDRKKAYLYVLTPGGMQEKVNATRAFLARKMAEFDAVSNEIRQLTVEVRELNLESEPAISRRGDRLS
jgi:MarR family transcriptional regulator, temperature-dependent positive regulator of motility